MTQILDPAKVTAFSVDAMKFLDGLEAGCQRAEITTPLRIAMFMANCSHESGGFIRTVENLNYSEEALLSLFPTHFDAATAAAYARQPEKIANRIYGGRMGNGFEASGDGWRFRGRGLIQITGRDNYQRYAEATGEDAIISPELLALPEGAAKSAAIFWMDHGLNLVADAGDLVKATKIINGGLNGLDDRRTLYNHALRVWAT